MHAHKYTLSPLIHPPLQAGGGDSLAGQPFHKREEGSGVVPIRELDILLPSGVQPNQIAPRHHQYMRIKITD